MRYVFYNKDEQERDLITNTLDKWCVPYNKQTHEHSSMFGTRYAYDIIIDVKPEKLDWVLDKVQERFNLENSFEAPSYQKPQEKVNKNDSVPSLFEDLFKPNFGKDLNKLTQEKENNKSAVEQIDELFEQLKPMAHELSDLQKLNDYLNKNGLMDKIKDISRKSLKEPNFVKDLHKLYNDKIKNLFNETQMEIPEDAIEITYNELPQPLRDDLEQEYPKKLLMSNKCRFYRTENGLIIHMDCSEE